MRPMHTVIRSVVYLIPVVAVLPVAAYEHPGGFHTKTQFEYVRNQVKAEKQPWKSGYEQLKSKATSWLSESPSAMADFAVPRYYGDQQAEHIRMKTVLSEDARAAYACALVYQLNINLSAAQRQQYADKAKAILNDWAYVNTRVSGGDGRLVMCYNGTALAFAAELLWDYSDWSTKDKNQFKSWAGSVLRYAASMKKVDNNGAGWGIMAAIAVNHLLDDTTAMASDIDRLKAIIDQQIRPDGGMPRERGRGSYSIWYTYFALAPLTACIEIVRNTEGTDLYEYDPPSHGSVKDALDFLFKHGVVDPSSWPIEKANNVMDPSSCGGNLFYAMGLVYDDKEYLKWVKHPVWRDTTGLAWICPSLMSPASCRNSR